MCYHFMVCAKTAIGSVGTQCLDTTTTLHSHSPTPLPLVELLRESYLAKAANGTTILQDMFSATLRCLGQFIHETSATIVHNVGLPSASFYDDEPDAEEDGEEVICLQDEILQAWFVELQTVTDTHFTALTNDQRSEEQQAENNTWQQIHSAGQIASEFSKQLASLTKSHYYNTTNQLTSNKHPTSLLNSSLLCIPSFTNH
eukprot:TRINITY_DN67715_c4_g1_i2.p1 TRINITY_DN67715_c4_g1~~TRINITY_DN67715_c4_g1_i2.p1  ORF type:complete len:201 (-),score=19.39 TRINITY_DN67715_c4_g1_i2:780-1382(-)